MSLTITNTRCGRAVFLCAVFAATSIADAPARGSSFSFQAIVGPTNQASFAYGISADGSTVIGYTHTPYQRAFRWTAEEGMVLLPNAPGAGHSIAYGISADGTTIVGESRGTNGRPFRWTAETGTVTLADVWLPDIPVDLGYTGIANAASADGSVVVGWNAEDGGVRWNADGSKHNMNQGGPNSGFFGEARGISDDGTKIVGSATTMLFTGASYWSAETGIVFLGNLPGGASANANGISGDGSVIVGNANSAEGVQAFRWTAEGGMVGLGDLPGGAFNSIANATSADGSVVVGQATIGPGVAGRDAFVWTAEGGMQSLRQMLLSRGITEVANWRLEQVTDISADGRTLVGIGVDMSQTLTTYRAFIVTIPEPGSWLLAIIGLAGLGALSRRRYSR